MMRPTLAAPLAVAMLAGAAQAASVQVAALRDLADLSLEELSNVEVTSVSGRAERVQDAPASIYVITAQEIRRSAAVTLPQVLRLAPNLQVAQVNAGQWAISARGFNNPIANKLLVLIDGRTVYSPLFSGVFWDANQVVLEDIERIEVISGPGGTLWGANAVHGVINIITRDAAATQGTLVSATRSDGGGRQVARWGGAVGRGAHMRLYALAHDRDNTRLASGAERADASSGQQAGFRADWEQGVSHFTFQGDFYRLGRSPGTGIAPDAHGGNLLARWTSRLDDGSPYKAQAYYDVADRDETILFRNRVQTLDLQFSHEPKVALGQLLWGAGIRRARDVNEPTAVVLFDPARRDLSWSNLFAQYQLPVGEHLELTAGAKAERNSYTGLEWLPNLRLAWRHSPLANSWAALSRVVRAPARIDREFFFPGRAPFIIAGGPNFQSETANVLEIGHRARVAEDFSYSATVFHHDYSGLRAGIPGRVPAQPENQIEGTSHGLEAWANWQATRHWRLSAGLTTLRKKLRFSSGAVDATSIRNLGNDPSHQWNLRSSLSVGRAEFDVMVRRVGGLPDPQVPAYTAVDLRLGMQVTPGMQLAVLGHNVFDRRHAEFEAPAAASQLPRRWWLQATWEL